MMEQTADKRSVATDALETLGMHHIPDNSGRDAIHLAVEPVIAGERIHPGQDIGIIDDRAHTNCKHIGIADPFVRGSIEPGERFWLVVYPRQITSLRHVWTHPDFNDGCSGCSSEFRTEQEKSEAWLRNYADEISEHFNTLMDAADAYLEHGDYFMGARTGNYYGKFEGERLHSDFWRHYQTYRSVEVPAEKQNSFFTCSC